MKKAIIISVLFLGMHVIAFAQGNPAALFKRQIEYSVSYQWDNINNAWISPVKNLYIYDIQGRTEQTISLNMITMDTLSRTIYFYNSIGKLAEYYYQNYSYGQWQNVRKYSITFDENGRTQTQIVVDWKEGNMIYNRKQDYFYNEAGQCIYLRYYGWNGTGWFESSTEYYFFDEQGHLIRTESFDMNGSRVNRVFYETNEFSKRTGMLVQGWANGDWFSVYRDTYNYDPCGNNITFLRQTFKNNTWLNQSKTEYFWGFVFNDYNNKKRCPVCHNGNTIYVPSRAVNNYILKGDCLGECLVENSGVKKTSPATKTGVINPIVVYPNPSSGNISVRVVNNDCSVSRIEIADMYGKIVRVMNTKGEQEATVYRDGLINGSYVMRVYGDQVYSVIIILK
jgi:hypothetical protein